MDNPDTDMNGPTRKTQTLKGQNNTKNKNRN